MSDLLEEIRSSDKNTIAIVVKKDFEKEGINFISKNCFPLQLGINTYSKDSEIQPHYHVDREIQISNVQEMLYIKKGAVLLNLYDAKKKPFKCVELSTGDLVLFVSGGHGLRMIEDTTLIEVKQGPYLGKDYDKVIINEKQESL